MKKKYMKGIRIIVLALLATIVTLATIILFPQKLFANKMKYKEFTVCSNDKIDDAIKIALDNAMDLVRKSELYDPDYTYNIILCHNTLYNKIDNKVFGTGPAARSRLQNVIIKVKIDPNNDLAFPTFRKACDITLTYLLAHEMIHCLQAKRYGISRFNPINHPEFWKLEGYPEYISRSPERSSKDYSLIGEINRYLDLESKSSDSWVLLGKGGCESPEYYYKGRLMIEYLMDIKHLSYDRVLNDTVAESSIYREMMRWKEMSRVIKE